MNISPGKRLCILDYGLGNLGSLQNMYKKLGISAVITESEQDVLEADSLILPGVGAFDAGIEGLERSGLIGALRQKVFKGNTPILGVCLGMQLLAAASEEGGREGLGFIDATVKRFAFPAEADLKVPHMGWNEVTIVRDDALIKGLNKMPESPRFYFVHSYYMECREPSDVVLRAHHGIEFDVAFRRNNIMGVQFHPEKSHQFGMQILKNFYDLPNVVNTSHSMSSLRQWQPGQNRQVP